MTLVREDPDVHVTDIDTARQRSFDVDAVVTVCQDSISDNVAGGTRYSQFNLADGETELYGGTVTFTTFEVAADMVQYHIERGHDILVHCHVGQSRAPSVTAAALAVVERISFTEALESIEDERPIVNPNQTLCDWGKFYVDKHSDD